MTLPQPPDHLLYKEEKYKGELTFKPGYLERYSNNWDAYISACEDETEWILEARAEGYTWKLIAEKYGVSIEEIKKFIKS